MCDCFCEFCLSSTHTISRFCICISLTIILMEKKQIIDFGGKRSMFPTPDQFHSASFCEFPPSTDTDETNARITPCVMKKNIKVQPLWRRCVATGEYSCLSGQFSHLSEVIQSVISWSNPNLFLITST